MRDSRRRQVEAEKDGEMTRMRGLLVPSAPASEDRTCLNRDKAAALSGTESRFKRLAVACCSWTTCYSTQAVLPRCEVHLALRIVQDTLRNTLVPPVNTITGRSRVPLTINCRQDDSAPSSRCNVKGAEGRHFGQSIQHAHSSAAVFSHRCLHSSPPQMKRIHCTSLLVYWAGACYCNE